MPDDRRVLDHLLYVYRLRQRFWRTEWSTDLDAPPRSSRL
jgi:hypothetical protein